MSQPGETDQGPKRPRRRWYQYSLRTLLGVMTVAVGLLVAWRAYVEPYARQRQTMKLIEQLGGTYQAAEAPKWARRLLGADLQDIIQIDLANCDRPHEYVEPVAALPALHTLLVGGIQFGDDHLRRLARLPGLQRLVLDSTAVSEEALSQYRASCPKTSAETLERLTRGSP